MELRAIQAALYSSIWFLRGTFINGQRTNQAVVYSGDVISLAGVNITFVRDVSSPNRNRGNTTYFPAKENVERLFPEFVY